MIRSLLSVCLAVALTAALPLAASGADGSWMPNLNPFGGKGKSTPRGHTSNAATSGWKVPKLWPSTGGTAASRPKPRGASQPTTWSRMTSGTQQFFSKTADTLTPWDNKKPAPSPTITGSNSFFTHNKPKDKKSGDIAPASWWSTEKNDAPKSVNEFLSRPRPN